MPLSGREPILGGSSSAGEDENAPRLGGDAAIAHLVETLESGDEFARMRAVETLQKVGGRAVRDALLRALDDPAQNIRLRAIGALGYVGGSGVVNRLIDMVGATDHPPTLEALFRALGRSGDPRVVPVLASFLTDWRLQLARAAAEGLHHIGQVHPEAVRSLVDQMVASLLDDDAQPYAALATIRAVRPGYIYPHLLAVALDEDESARRRALAIRGLRALGDKQASPHLIHIMRTATSGYVLHWAVQALKVIRVREAIPALVDLLDHPNYRARAHAAAVLGIRRSRTAVPALIAHLSDSRAEVRGEAARALARIGAVEAIPALHAAVDDPVRRVRIRVYRALVKLEGLSPDG